MSTTRKPTRHENDDTLFGSEDLSPQLSPALLARQEALAARRLVAKNKQSTTIAIFAKLSPRFICGLDEVGRGPLAGPVAAAAVVLDPENPIDGLADSKVLSSDARELLAPLIRSKALAWGLGWVWPEEIERLNIHHASLLAMRRAFAVIMGMPVEKGQPQTVAETGEANLPNKPGVIPGTPVPASDSGPRILSAHDRKRLLHAVADGKHLPDLSGLSWDGEIHTLVKGDALVPAISAASIIAKVARDAWMCRYAQLDTRYGFERHMGYPVPEHWAALEKHGPCPIHRLSWVRKRLPDAGLT